ncbi:isoprenylcysteine carboxylmethyltransferase family protein [uncultured Nitratireductor sp.]|uniref:methyltransferase family protein n=1 Tax=uncultured Nitratireductor sp. TaxID=520953 RepID=UPI0026013184|nr:isoprenylcysteine carboxylmethyltransferase family protein [uncultured Nitratireductor sp.]
MNVGEDALHTFQRHRIKLFWSAGLLLTVFLFLFRPTWEDYQPHTFDMEVFIVLTGVAFVGVGIMGRLWCTLYIGGRKAGELVQSGPYSVCRNPLYLFSTLAALGVGAQTGSILVALICGFVAALFLHFTAKREERFLREKFGAAYERYRSRVPAFLPDWRLFQDPDAIEIRPKRLYRTLLDGLAFYMMAPAYQLIETLQDGGALPILVRLF